MIKHSFHQIREWLGKNPRVSTPASTDAPSIPRVEFMLVYEGFPIGTLSYQDSIWEWAYSDRFRSQNDIVPLIEFPDVNQPYTTAELWPFFATRAPSLKRDDIQQIIQRERIDENDEVALLKRFGKRTITNPFDLVVA